MTSLEADRTRRDQPYVTSHARAVAAHIMAAIHDPTTLAPSGPMPFMTPRVAGVFDRIMAGCCPGAAPTEAVDVLQSSALPPPRKPRRR